jgi:hypothetical protein
MLTPWLLLAAPVIAAVLLWGSWGWFGAAVAVTVLEYVALQTQRAFFSASVADTGGRSAEPPGASE